MQNGYMSLNNGAESDESRAVMVDHHNCRLGKWYDSGPGYELFRNMPTYPRLSTPHAAVHENIHSAIHLLHEEWDRDAAIHPQLIHHFERAEEASWCVVTSIEQLLAERHPELSST